MARQKSSKSELTLDEGYSLTSQALVVESLLRRIRFLNDQEREHLAEATANLRKLEDIRQLVARGEELSDDEADIAASHLVRILTRS